MNITETVAVPGPFFETFSQESLIHDVETFQWVHGETWLTSTAFMVGIHIFYVIGLMYLKSVAKSQKEKPTWLRGFAFYHNVVSSLLALFMLVGFVYGAMLEGRFESWDNLYCQLPKEIQIGIVPFCMYLFYLSKMLEFVDTGLLILGKKNLTWLHTIHHLTTMSLVWHCMAVKFPIDVLPAAANCLVHFIMYLYFAKPIGFLRQSITVLQITQFLVVLYAVGDFSYRKYTNVNVCTSNADWSAILHSAGLYGLYLVMFSNFYIQQYLNKSSVKSVVQAGLKDKSGKSRSKKTD
eukprot:TRINITY_DN16742_c0_g1_i1.p1 TRINITY_DN16742_c0_g1~~TRINITY_DN16742_c0_g1_i1.p1  ORF type:complete len:303 (+),score=51.14 TRINITY_DN16742_c0_g1_i1:29-910(+)